MLRAGLLELGVPSEVYQWEGRLVERLYRLVRRRIPLPAKYNPLLYLEEALRVFSQVGFFGNTPRGHQLYHITNPALSWVVLKRRPSVVTVHDMVPFVQPRFLSDRLIRRSMRYMAQADLLICVSEHTRREVLENMAVDEGRIRVVHNGVRHDLFYLRNKADARQALGLPHDATIVLHIGSEEPRKNIEALLTAFHQLMSRVARPLLLRVGESTPISAKHISSLGIQERVHYLSGLTDVGAVYAAADVLCFPSTHEGFGFPPLEAMASGCPVVASNRSAIPEVVGEAGLLVNPDDPAALAKGMLQVMEDADLRNVLVRRGITRAAEFSWERCARETLEVYRELAPGVGA